MKHLYFTALFAFSTSVCSAQGSSGLVAHWTFNGNANDISGHGINGIVYGATLDSGFNGLPNTAYKFKGPDSLNGLHDSIHVAYNSLMNLTKFSICALIKVTNYSNKYCQTSSILWRGTQWASDYYALYFNDDVYDGSCVTATPSNNIFLSDYGNLSNTVPPSNRGYTNYMSLNTWSCVTATFDGDTTKIYVDGVLEKKVAYTYSLTTSTNGLSIGASYDLPGNYPFPFIGKIDDIRLYSRALSLAEVNLFCDTAKMAPPSSILETSSSSEIQIVPNPAHNDISVQISGNTLNGSIQIINTLGQIVVQQQIAGNNNHIDLSQLASGIYIVRVQNEQQITSNRIFKN